MLKHENKCTLASRPPAHEVNSPWSSRRPYMHKPGDDSAGTRSNNDGREEDSAADLRVEADNLYSRQDNPPAPPSDPKANVITKKQEKSHFRSHDGPPMNNGWYETPPRHAQRGGQKRRNERWPWNSG
jgi:hypothetical protein